MPKPKIVRMKQEAVDTMRITAPNMVLIHINERNVDRRTKGGLWLISPTDTDWNPDQNADRRGIIVQVPAALIKQRDHLWKTEVEVKVGDCVWFDPMVGENTDTILTETNKYILLDYFSLHLCKRGDDVICLNGYNLFTPCEDKVDSALALDWQKFDSRYAILKYKGSLNKYYFHGLDDDGRIEIGDKCIFKQPPVMLESEYHAMFDGKVQYRISQLYNIAGFIRGDKLCASLNHVVIEPETPTHTKGGIEIPLAYRKATGFGTVYDSGYYELVKGDRVYYAPTSAVKIEHEGKNLEIINFNNIYYNEYRG